MQTRLSTISQLIAYTMIITLIDYLDISTQIFDTNLTIIPPLHHYILPAIIGDWKVPSICPLTRPFKILYQRCCLLDIDTEGSHPLCFFQWTHQCLNMLYHVPMPTHSSATMFHTSLSSDYSIQDPPQGSTDIDTNSVDHPLCHAFSSAQLKPKQPIPTQYTLKPSKSSPSSEDQLLEPQCLLSDSEASGQSSAVDYPPNIPSPYSDVIDTYPPSPSEDFTSYSQLILGISLMMEFTVNQPPPH